MSFGPAPCQGVLSGVNYNEANKKFAERKADKIYLLTLKNVNVEGSNRKCRLVSLAGKFLDFIDAELKNQGNLQQLATEIEFYPEISVIARYWNLQLKDDKN